MTESKVRPVINARSVKVSPRKKCVRGQGLVEFGLMIGMIALVSISSLDSTNERAPQPDASDVAWMHGR
jgi:hypothetical protein